MLPKAKLCETVSSLTSTSVAWQVSSRPTWQQPVWRDARSCSSCGRSLLAPFKKVTALAVSCCCVSGVATESIGRRCVRSTWRKEVVASAQKIKAKAHLPWGNMAARQRGSRVSGMHGAPPGRRRTISMQHLSDVVFGRSLSHEASKKRKQLLSCLPRLRTA